MSDKQIDGINHEQDKLEKPIKVYKTNVFLSMMLFIVGTVVLVMAVFLSVLFREPFAIMLCLSSAMIILSLIMMSTDKILIFSNYIDIRPSFGQSFIRIFKNEIVAVETEYYKNIIIHIKNQDEEYSYDISMSNMHPEDRSDVFKYFQEIAAKNSLDKS